MKVVSKLKEEFSRDCRRILEDCYKVSGAMEGIDRLQAEVERLKQERDEAREVANTLLEYARDDGNDYVPHLPWMLEEK